MGAHLAGGLTPLLVTWTLTILPWRGVFIVFGLIGFVWAAVWMWWFRNDPSEHKDVNAAELAYIERGRPAAAASHESLRDILRLLPNRNMAALCLMYFTQTYGFYFIITWLPTYLENVYGVSSMRLGLLAGLPLLFSVAADLLGGISTDRAVGRWGLRWGRASVGIFAFTGASAVLFAGTQAPNVLWAAVLIGVAGAFSNFPLGAAWGAAVDIGGARSGAVSAAMNTAGQVGGMLSPIIAGYSVQNYGSWALPLYIQASLYGVGALCWFFIDAGKPLAPATPSSHS
jgi:MFS transporter, ACS family, glucarate transporter